MGSVPEIPEALAEFARALAAGGLNLVGAVPAADGKRLTPGANAQRALGNTKTLLVCGSGGPGHWESIPAEERADELCIQRAGERAIEAALGTLPAPSRLLPLRESSAFDLRRLAEAAGFGVLSPYLEILIHPTYGPWVSIRGVVATELELSAAGPLQSFDPCGPCARPCLDACPSGAYGRGHTFDFMRCAAHRLREREPEFPCADACRSRAACPVGAEHAYGFEEHRHRHRASLDAIAAYYREMKGR